jgi:hypothetical protein
MKLRCQDFAGSSWRFPCHLSFILAVCLIHLPAPACCYTLDQSQKRKIRYPLPPPTVLYALFDLHA